MADDYKVSSMNDRSIRLEATKLREELGLSGCKYLDLVAVLQLSTIMTRLGERRLTFEVLPNGEMGADDAHTSFAKNSVSIELSASVYDQLLRGVGRARMTVAHELGHARLHKGPTLSRKTIEPVRPAYLAPYESAEHQAKVFAPEFLAPSSLIRVCGSIDEIARTFGLSSDAARIRFEECQSESRRSANASRMRSLAAELKQTNSPNNMTTRHAMLCPACAQETLLPLTGRYICIGPCNRSYDSFPDGDSSAF